MDLQQPGQADQGPEVAVDVRLEVPATPTEVADIRHAVRSAARAYGIDQPQLGDICLAVTEACANVVTHAYRNDPNPGPLTVEAYRLHGDFVVTVSDAGTGIEPRGETAGLGLGLSLIAHTTRRMEIAPNDPTGSRVLMAFAIGKA